MKIFLTVLTLIIGLQSWANSETIKDFEIEGMSVGDSILKYFSEDQIKNYQDEIQKVTDEYTNIINDICKNKETEIMQI